MSKINQEVLQITFLSSPIYILKVNIEIYFPSKYAARVLIVQNIVKVVLMDDLQAMFYFFTYQVR